MNLIVGAPWWLVAFLILALIAAAIEDAWRLRISNIISLAVVVGALIAAGVHGFSPSLWQNALVFAVILALGTAAFAAGWLGGGDVKLFAAIGLWVDLRNAVDLVAAILIAGGVVGLAYLIGRRLARRKPGRIPYGLAIVAGALFIFNIQYNTRASNPFIEHMQQERAANR